jgi:anti-sigma B factor antagonist
VDLSISSSEQAGRHVVAVSGEVDVHTAAQLGTAMDTVIDAGALHLVVDLTDTPFLDSTGLSVLVRALNRVRVGGGSVRIVAPADRIAKVFRLTGLDTTMPLYADLTAAVAVD